MKRHDFNIILDLDQTLISAEATDEFNFEKHKKKSQLFKFHNMDDYYIVFERPGLQKFLTFLFNNFNVSVWTAASRDYCLFIVDNIILKKHRNRKLDWIFFSYHCDISKKIGKCTKDLDLLWDFYKIKDYNKNNTMIIDDFDDVYKHQKDNCIVAEPFEVTERNSERDDFLVKLTPLLKNIVKTSEQRSSEHINNQLK
jgi:TFIIF-interacting CTD phosphatase-like protein